MIDELPDDALQRAEQALKYCANPGATRLTIEKAKERVGAMSMKRLEEHGKRTGHGFITGIGSGVGATMPAGDFQSSMSACDDGPITYYLRGFSGYMFEIYERLELAKDEARLVLTQRIVGPNGSEQMLIANMPVS